MKFYLIEKQSGQGCDYTIGCGTRVTEIEAAGTESAREKALEIVGDAWKSKFENSVETAILVVHAQDLAPFLDARKQEQDRAEALKKATEQEQRERAELERLRAKFGA